MIFKSKDFECFITDIWISNVEGQHCKYVITNTRASPRICDKPNGSNDCSKLCLFQRMVIMGGGKCITEGSRKVCKCAEC